MFLAGLSVPLVTFAKWGCQDRDGRRTWRNTPCREFSHHPAHVAHFTAAFYTQSIQARPGAPEKAGPGHCPVQEVHGRTDPSNRRERLYTRRRRLHARIVNVRNDVHHKATTAIAKSAGLVVREPECKGHDEQPETGKSSGQRRHLRLPGKAGLQVPVVRRRACERQQVVPVLQTVLPMRTQERLPDPVGPTVGLPKLRRGERKGRDLNAALNLERAGFELPGAGRGDRVRPAMPALVCEASSESRFEAWPPAKLEYQILNSGAPLPYRAGAGVVSTSGSRREFSGIPAPHGERKRQTMTRWVCATIRPR